MNTIQLLTRGSACGFLLLVLTAFSRAQVAEDAASHFDISLGIRAGYALPIGDWKAHPFAHVDQFSGGLTVGGELEIRLTSQVSMAIVGDYARLDVSDWEDYAGARGDAITASASIGSVALLLRPHLINAKPSVLSLDVGFAIAFSSGNERSERFAYEYDFMKSPGYGVLLGAEYAYFVGEAIALTVRGSSMFIFSGVSYADGAEYTLTLATLAGGVRFYF